MGIKHGKHERVAVYMKEDKKMLNTDFIAMSEEEFNEVVVLPIRGAYRCDAFLDEKTEKNSRKVWYEALKYSDKYVMKSAVELLCEKKKKIPMLADVCDSYREYANYMKMKRDNK